MKRFIEGCAGFVLVGVLCVSAGAKTHRKAHRVKPLKVQIAELLDDPRVAQAHWGIAVTKMDGSPIYSMNEGQLFQPASNAKLFTTAAAMALLGPGTTYETKVVARGVFDGVERMKGNLVLMGAGDANLSGRVLPYVAPADRPVPAPPAPAALRYLEEMADQVAATGLKVVNGDVVGDDTLFPWEPYAPDWAIDDAVWGYGAPVSALSINDNQIKVTVTPGALVGAQATFLMEPAVSYYNILSDVQTVDAKGPSSISYERLPGSKDLRIYGTIALNAAPDVEEIAIDDPAEYGALAFKGMLEARGVVVTGKAVAQHQIWPRKSLGFLEWSNEVSSGLQGVFAQGGTSPECSHEVPAGGSQQVVVLARHRSAELREDLVVTNKVSQNLHAELFLRQLAMRYTCQGYVEEGAGVVRAFLTAKAGIDKDDFVFFDGSGLSGHDLVAPRATAKLLQYASTQPWFADWKRSLPVGGEDGSLAERFAKTSLKDHVFAKTGTLSEARALSGYLESASGQTVIFSIMVGSHMPWTHVDRDVMDKIVAAIAATN
jgi:D-alanyl-D-alanine carboxypeptidase/D-alanyl-D-alanine-endopeptidase (penicillin-binding protein 4)